MTISNRIIGNILGKPRKRGGRKDYDGDGVPNKKDCQPRNTMRQDKDAAYCFECGQMIPKEDWISNPNGPPRYGCDRHI